MKSISAFKKSSGSRDTSKILIIWFDAQETFPISRNNENNIFGGNRHISHDYLTNRKFE